MVFMISITAISAADLNDAGDVLNDGDKSFDDLNKAITVENSNFILTVIINSIKELIKIILME